MRRDPEAMKRAAARRQREDNAARLQAKVPELKSLSLHIEEGPMGLEGAWVSYVRHVVVERAPALFEIPCGDRACRDGGHDLTRRVMRALQSGKAEHSGRHRCEGSVNGDDCPLELSFVVHATYG